MLVLVDDGNGNPLAIRVSLWRRAVAQLRSFSLDEAIAGGASPDSRVDLALRAQWLMRARARKELARSARRILETARDPALQARMRVPVCRARVRACTPEFEELIGSLLGTEPVAARGVAQVSALFADARGPIYNPANGDDLSTRIRGATYALSVF